MTTPSVTAEDARPVLGIESCGAEATLALARISTQDVTNDSVELLRTKMLAARTAGSLLTTSLGALLEDMAPSTLRAIVVVRGPGSFTGMRIGLSAAKALSEATGVPIVGVSRLAVFAFLTSSPRVALDAGRGNVYVRNGGDEQMLTADEVREHWSTDQLAAMAVCEDRVLARFPEARLVAAPDAADALRFARARVMAADWDSAETLDALYLWRPEQMLTRAAGTG